MCLSSFRFVSKFFDVTALAAAGCLVACETAADPVPAAVPNPVPAAAPAAAPAAGSAKEADEPGDEGVVELHPKLAEYIASLQDELGTVPEDRRKQLEKLALFIKTKRDSGEAAKITFICTHNSRRSHLSQLWAATAAAHFGLTGVETYSGGTESTAFNPRAVAALQRAGFEISAPPADAENPRYRVTYSPQGPTLEAFSKKYTESPNPTENFAAIMTCSQADKNCPTVDGAALRVPIPYEDPKDSDGTPEEAATYDARAKQIATEMFYLFSKVAS